ncbi:MAG TPA: VWA domain-containing protein [Terracidiphilus sp.]|jgi:VWFA-related protein|nr:VWA domain-containing protein [Terracidiphilus sp.]
MNKALLLPAAIRRLQGFLGLLLAIGFSLVLAAQQPATPPANPPAQQTQQPASPSANPSAQQPQQAPAANPPQQEENPTFVIQRNEVNLIFTVTDRHGRYIPNLQLNDFALLDDGRAPQSVTSFRQQINLPLRVGIVIDSSTSIRSRFQFEQQSATEFLSQTLQPKSDRAFVMDFDQTPTVDADWTNDLDKLEGGVNRIRPGGGTALFDAVYTACKDKLLDIGRGQEPVRKAMVLISDGDDNQSRVRPEEAIKECERAETVIYAISTNWTPSRGKGDDVLSKMSTETGGQVFFPPSVEEMSNSFKTIQEALRSQYALTYVPAEFKANGLFRPIYLYCNDRKYQVMARKGYFAPKP